MRPPVEDAISAQSRPDSVSVAHSGTPWDKANPGKVYDPELFRWEILPRLRTVPLAEIMEAAGCSKASASDYRRGKRTPHLSTWVALGELVGVEMNPTALS